MISRYTYGTPTNAQPRGKDVFAGACGIICTIPVEVYSKTGRCSIQIFPSAEEIYGPPVPDLCGIMQSNGKNSSVKLPQKVHIFLKLLRKNE
jgi:hypothetical protein